MSRAHATRCVLLFTRPPAEEGASKGIPRARALFDQTARRIAAAVARMDGVDLVVPAQRGSGFGERLVNAFTDLRALGYLEIVAVPADAPGLGHRQIREAFDALGTHDVALGPSPDGGVYLIGLGSAAGVEPLLTNIRWRTAAVFKDLIARAQDPAILDDRITDVDGAQSLNALRDDPTLDRSTRALIERILAPAPPPPSRETRLQRLTPHAGLPPLRAPPDGAPAV